MQDSREPTSRLSEYLKNVGLAFNPFEKLEASADPRLLTYLIGHPAIDQAWSYSDVLITGQNGSGRTAVAEHLLYCCRVGGNFRENTLPLILRAGEIRGEDVIGALEKSAAAELLLKIFYHPGDFNRMDVRVRREAVAAMEAASPGMLDQLLPQVESYGSHLPAVQYSDPAGITLPNPPNPARVREAVEKIRDIKENLTFRKTRLASPLEAIVPASGAKEVMIIADVDREQSREVMEVVGHARQKFPLRGKTTVKLLVPTEDMDKDEVLAIQKQTGEFPAYKMEWRPEQLIEVLKRRVKVASGGEFGSLDMISNRELRDEETDVEEKIILSGDLRIVTPRDAISFAGDLLQAGAESGNILLTQRVFTGVKEKFIRK